MDRKAFQVIQVVLGIAIVIFTALAVQRHWDEVRAASLEWTVRPVPLLGGILVVWLVFILLSEAWRRTVAGFGYELPRWLAARIWLLSSMAKYVPGKIWSFASIAMMGSRRGVPAWVTTGSALLLQILSLATGALIVAVAGASLVRDAAIGRVGLLALGLGGLAAIVIALSPPFASRMIARFAPRADPHHIPSVGTLGFGAGMNLLSWPAYGLALWLFATGTMPGIDLTVLQATGGFTAAYVVGNLTPFAPSGLGVREAVMVLAFGERIGFGPALALAAVGRLGHTVAEIGAVIPFLAWKGEAAG